MITESCAYYDSTFVLKSPKLWFVYIFVWVWKKIQTESYPTANAACLNSVEKRRLQISTNQLVPSFGTRQSSKLVVAASHEEEIPLLPFKICR